MSKPVVKYVDDNEAEKLIKEATLPLLIFFTADWCTPCNAFAPILDELAHELKSKLMVVKVEMEDNQRIGTRYGVRSLPTSLLFKNTAVADSKIGASTKGDMLKFIKAAL